jgi:CRISPR-associated protein Csm1
MHREIEIEALYALLHDVGKPVQRFLRRVRKNLEKEGVERALAALSKLTGMSREDLLADAERISHEEATDWIINALSKWDIQIPQRVRSTVEEVVRKADRMAASERRLGEPYELSKLMYSLVRSVFEESGLGVKYEAEYVPLLLPTWVLRISGYQELVGLKSYFERSHGGRLDLVEGFVEVFKPLASELEVCIKRTDQCDVKALRNHIEKLLVERARVLSDPMWLPVRVISARNLLYLEAKGIKEAIESSSYAEAVEELINKLLALLELYEPRTHGITRGFVDSLDQIVKYTCLLVPSAVYATVTPDISLYSHSKLVAAYTSAYIASQGGKARLLTIDSNQIQQFIGSPQRAGAASRVLRGRSLIVELILDALANYTLVLFNNMPLSSVVVSEGGTLDIVIPDLPDIEKHIARLRAVARDVSLNEFNGRLSFTIACSRSFNVEELDFLGSLVKGGGFYNVLESLSLDLALNKATRLANEPLYIDAGKIADFDALTREPVPDEDLKATGFALKVSEETIEYANRVAGPNKLSIGDTVGRSTHLSLIGGTLARNLIAVIGIYVYRRDDGLPLPDSDALTSITRDLAREICGERELLCDVKIGEVGIRLGFIPLTRAGALYVLISAKKIVNPLTREYAQQAWSAIASFLKVYADLLVKHLERLRGRVIRVAVKTVNTFIDFIPSMDLEAFEGIKAVVKALLDREVDVSFSNITINPWHPTRDEVELKDLDEYDIIAIGKMDCDKLGDVRRLLSFSPSRLLTFSELLNLILAGKSYLRVFENKVLYGDVIALYAGGDDAVFYGHWIPVISYIARVYEDISRALHPLTFSVGLTLDKSDAPIILLYGDAIELLEKVKRRSRAACALRLSNPVLVAAPGKTVYELIDVMPLEAPSNKYPWVDDVTGYWNFTCMARILERLYLADKQGEFRDFKNVLIENKRDIYLVSMLGAKLARALEGAAGTSIDMSKILRLLVPIELEYAYLWARRSDALKRVSSALISVCREAKMLAWPEEIEGSIEGLHTALRTVLAAKPILDHILLALRM